MILFDKLEIINKELRFNDEEYDAIRDRVERFTEEMSHSAKYYARMRNATSALDDICLGKYAEEAALKYLTELGYPATELDYAIRKGKQKGWIADIIYDDANFHIKSCSRKTVDYVSKRRGDTYSWTFQWANKNGGIGGRDPIFELPDDTIIFVYLDSIYSREPLIVATSPVRAIMPLLNNPISTKLIGLKRCVYYKDMLNANCDTLCR